MRLAVAWTAIYVARALEWWRVYVWNTFWFEGPTRDWCSRPFREGRVNCRINTPLGTVLDAAFHWCYPAAVWLTRRANAWLPPLGPGDGFLKRLYAGRY